MCDFYGAKGVAVREKPLCVSFKVDDIINQLVENCKNHAIKSDWLRRQADHAKSLKERQVDELEIDSRVDVRDANFVWCTGTVTLIIEQMEKETLYAIHYDGRSTQDDEVIYKGSERLAKQGFFSSRAEIPRF